MKTILVCLALTWPLLAAAQDVWRCGPDGRAYSATPCAEGRRLALVDDTPAAGEVQAARAIAARDQRLAEALRRERLQRETVAPGAGLAGFSPQRADVKSKSAKAKSGLRSKHRLGSTSPADDRTWRAVAPASRPTKG